MKEKAKDYQCQRDEFQGDDQFIENDEKTVFEKINTMGNMSKGNIGEVRSKK